MGGLILSISTISYNIIIHEHAQSQVELLALSYLDTIQKYILPTSIPWVPLPNYLLGMTSYDIDQIWADMSSITCR